MIIKKSKLRRIITECVRNVINEGYSSKGHQDEIVSLAKEIYDVIVVNGKFSYETNFSKPYEDEYGRKCYRTTNIFVKISEKEDAYANRNGITLCINKNTSLNTIAKLLMHEFTHVFDEVKNKETNFKDDDLYTNLDSLYDVPKGIVQIIYHLWIPTEFNAFQTTFDFKDDNFNEMFERFMGYIKEAYELPTTKGTGWRDDYVSKWNKIRSAVQNHIPNRYHNCSVESFKRYFVNQSLALMKKLVKKWNGEQNTNFIK